jgi:hypothetical protein
MSKRDEIGGSLRGSGPSPGISALAGFVVGSILSWLYAWATQREERPPIIVRGGSLYFTSGDRNSKKPEHAKGKQWKQRKSGWEPKHAKGRDISCFVVDLYPEDHTEKSPKQPETYKTKALTVTQLGVEFEVSIRTDGDGNEAPAVFGPVQPVGGGPNWTLASDRTESRQITDVSFVTLEGHRVVYRTPALVVIWQH